MKPGEKVLRVLDVLTNIATIGAACAIIAVVWFRYGPSRQHQGVQPPGIETGAHVPIEGIDWKRSQRTVVLVLSTQCHFCTESAGFYREISKRRHPDVLKLVAVFREDVEAGRKFLSDHAIDVDEVLQRPVETTGAKGTPALLLVDAAGNLNKAWMGRVPPTIEQEILEQLPRSTS